MKFHHPHHFILIFLYKLREKRLLTTETVRSQKQSEVAYTNCILRVEVASLQRFHNVPFEECLRMDWLGLEVFKKSGKIIQAILDGSCCEAPASLGRQRVNGMKLL